jgi:hypothetical protein
MTSADVSAAAAAGHGPVLSVVRGSATAEEVAALTVVLLAVSSGAADGPGDLGAPGRDALRRGGEAAWGNRSALLGRSLPPGPDAWRAGSRPG